MIHCIGDSHSSVFSGNEEMQPIWPQRSDDNTLFFKSYRIGPATAYQLSNKITIIEDVIRKNVNLDNDYVLFCFGEVDIRAHLIKQMELQNKTITDVVKECVDRYIETILYFKNNGVRVLAWGPIASWNESKPYNGGPSFGTSFERNTVTEEFNNYLKEVCDKKGVGFITIFDKMIDENKITNSDLLDDWEDCHIHLNQLSMPFILKVFSEQGLI
jgi:hypothetical protein